MPFDINEETIKFYRDKKVLITGGTGTLGSKIGDILFKLNINCNITCISRDEYKQWQKKREGSKLNYILGDITDPNLNLSNIDIVIHTAALKHIDFAEKNTNYAVNNNINGTMNLINLANKFNIKYFITVSTDKACLPTNTYGASKFLSERITINNLNENMKCCVIRLGNIFASRGSVSHVFHENLMKDNNITVYNKDMTRYTVTLDESAKITINSIIISEGNDVIVPKFECYKILDLAKVFYKVYKNINIENDIEKYINVTQLRKSEKINEDLICNYEFNNIKEFENYYICNLKDEDYKNRYLRENKYISLNKLENLVKQFKEQKRINLFKW